MQPRLSRSHTHTHTSRNTHTHADRDVAAAVASNMGSSFTCDPSKINTTTPLVNHYSLVRFQRTLLV